MRRQFRLGFTMMALLLCGAALRSASVAQSGPFDPFADEDDPEHLVAVDLITSTPAMPGSQFLLGVRFKIAPEWHLYWENPGDTGVPMRVELDLPEGFTAGETRWPAPSRYVHTGLVDYIFEDEVTLVTPIRVSEGVELGAHGEIRAEVSWLVCQEECIPGSTTVTTGAYVAPWGTRVMMPADIVESFMRAESRWPRKIDPSSVGAASWSGETLELRAEGATRVAYYPLEPSHPAPENIVEGGAAEGDRLQIVYPARALNRERVTGVLEVWRGDSSEVFNISVAPPARD